MYDEQINDEYDDDDDKIQSRVQEEEHW